MKISACLITLNEEKNLARCLHSIAPFVDEILIVDSGSTDRTLEIAREFGAVVISQPWLGYVGQKNFALDHATQEWVLSLDADEEVSPELATSIMQVKAATPDGPAADPAAPNGYQISRIVFYQGRWIWHGDWYPDLLVRLFRRAEGRFAGGRVHERLELPGAHPILPGQLHHYTYDDAEDRAERIIRYAELWAETAHERGRQAGPWTGPLHALVRFFRGYFLKRGFLDGALGWEIAAGNAQEVNLKYDLLRQMNSKT